MKDFIFQTTPKIIFGENSFNLLDEEINKLNIKRLAFICTPSISKQKFFTEKMNYLEKKGFNTYVYNNITPDPSFENCDEAIKLVNSFKSEIIIGIGGGSAMDIAKLVAAIANTKISSKQALEHIHKIKREIPLIQIPSTAGTGSEVTHISIFSDTQEKVKVGIVSPNLYADIAILDPKLSLSLPPNITAYSGIDAIIHAMEALQSKLANPFTDFLAKQALKILYQNIFIVFKEGQNIQARSQMLYASMLAGQAFANSSVAAIHAFAYPIGAEYKIPHGLANAIMLMPILKFNLETGIHKYKELAQAIGIDTENKNNIEIANQILKTFDNLLNNLNIVRNLSAYGVNEKDIDRLAQSVIKITRLINNNPRNISLDEAKTIYYNAL